MIIYYLRIFNNAKILNVLKKCICKYYYVFQY